MKKIFTAFLIFACLPALAQFNYVLDESVLVTRSGTTLPLAWTGGLNAAQYNTLDLNNDGVEDLVLFDRMAQKVFTFVARDGKYVHAPEYEYFFPDQVSNWLLIRDFNHDGKKDIFTGDILGMRVFRNVTTGDTPSWSLFYFYAEGARSEVVLTKGLSGMINLQMQYDDLPAIADADGDGDLDVFSIDYGGSGTVNFHRNYSKERYNSYDSLTFELVDKSWGDFRECSCASFAFNNEPCPEGGRVGRTEHAGGKGLLVFDANNDGNSDVLLSEANCIHLSLLTNLGSIDAPVFESSALYPSFPASFIQFPTGYLEDVDFDGVKDLIVSPNIFSKSDYGTDLVASNWLYKNTGTNAAPNFQLQTKAFLQDNMLDFGDNAVPAVGDADGDGDLDLFVSNNNYPATIFFIENIGTVDDPRFDIKDEDFARLSTDYFRNLKIQFADVNKDGNADLVLTGIPGWGNTSGLFYIPNRSKTSLSFEVLEMQQIAFTVSGSENVLLTDVNSDGNPDILKGRSNGALEYWKNTGGLSFVLEDGDYLGITSSPLLVNPTIGVGDLNVDGNPDLILGTSSEGLRIFNDYRKYKDGDATFSDIVFNPLLNQYVSPNLGGKPWPVVANFFGKSSPAIVVGTTLGGVRFLRSAGQISESPYINIYPNPVTPSIGELITMVPNTSATLQIYSATGALIADSISIQALEANTFDPYGLAAGLYLFRFQTPYKTITHRVVIR